MDKETDPQKVERLISWKRIARHFARSERTVRRWEREENLPIHRLKHGRASSVYAYTGELDAWLAGGSQPPLPNAPPHEVDDEAKAFYEKGLHQLGQMNPQAFFKAVEDFNNAIRLVPTFASAHARKAEALQLLNVFGALPPHEAMPEALETLAKALSYAPKDAEVNATLGLVLTCYSYDWLAAEKAFETAIAANPNLVAAHQWQAETFADLGKFEDADAAIERAYRLDPASLSVCASNAYILWLSRRYGQLIHDMEDLITRNPYFPLAYINLGLAQVETGDLEKAAHTFSQGVDKTGGNQDILSLQGYALARASDVKGANGILTEITRFFGNRSPGAFQKAVIHIGLGSYEKALSHLETAFEQRYWHLNMIGQGAVFDPLRSSVKFQNLLDRTGLSKSAISLR